MERIVWTPAPTERVLIENLPETFVRACDGLGRAPRPDAGDVGELARKGGRVKRKKCNTVLTWKMMGGLLIIENRTYAWRCPGCRASGEQSNQPKLGQRCAKLVDAVETGTFSR